MEHSDPHELVDVDIPGLAFPEGPRWRDGWLWFADQLGGGVHRVSEDGAHEVVAVLDQPSGLGFLPGGELVAATMSQSRVVLVDGGRAEELADLRPLASHLNDMFVDPDGRLYLDAYGPGFSGGSLLLVERGRMPEVAAEELAFPNGVAATPDGRTLLVAETFAGRISAFELSPEGRLSGRRVWADLPGKAPDGLCLDAEGAAWVACYRTGEFLRVREGGAVADRVAVGDRWAMACALGGADGRTLFLCSAVTTQRDYAAGKAVGYLQRCRVEVPGVGRP
ncbi:MAG TPA: SMP-30/gluconolactonase/LRE family protein [Acidimicrobiales bacterium]|nr:SMP-30/gluconolactonase/LRE family protein [Acidimicrobiales bacterium]